MFSRLYVWWFIWSKVLEIIGEFGGVFDPGGVVALSLWFSLLFPLSIQGIWLVDSFKAEFNAERSMGCCILLEAVARFWQNSELGPGWDEPGCQPLLNLAEVGCLVVPELVFEIVLAMGDRGSDSTSLSWFSFIMEVSLPRVLRSSATDIWE
ncbi:hypothetical protein BT96DRAFT_938356 [Gymnopus androsaceus JB14]|uniref:Uncharacterized protein n=1 Tax=Gymnopus androsaceus JB14 TaxID=1447944 RepID=A0A6A4HT13_9AGAR|nr:hypothetical protein BT96DRAFT_938356 [Gymnopus androsaceus JB14]